jgi:hypothetical protein
VNAWRWIALGLSLFGLGFGPLRPPPKVVASEGFGKGLSAPLPQHFEVKTKLGFLLTLFFAASIVVQPYLDLLVLPSVTKLSRKRLYLVYARLQTDGG